MEPTPPFYIQIVDSDGVLIKTRAGGAHEAELISLFINSILPKGVGFFKTQAQVEQAIKAGIKEALRGLKVKNPYDIE